MALIALKVDVDTLRGTREGVPRLLAMLDRHRARATFLFSLGPDHTGWALKRVFRPGFLGKVSRTSVVKHYGLRTLMHGVLLPAPDIGRVAAGPMRAARAAGHECGIHTWDHVVWQDNVRHRDEAWTRRQMNLAWQRYVEVFGEPPATHGAAGWQMNAAALRQLDDWGLRYASDGRGSAPYRPHVDGRVLAHLQLPTTLPTMDELIGTGGVDEGNVAGHLLARTAHEGGALAHNGGEPLRGNGTIGAPHGGDNRAGTVAPNPAGPAAGGAGRDTLNVYTLHAELEGGLLAPAFDALLQGWRVQGHRLGTLGDAHAMIDPDRAAAVDLAWGEVPGRSGALITAP